MIIVVGLGNPGREYIETRHNVGWMVVSSFCTSSGFPDFVQSAKHSGRITTGTIGKEGVFVLLPQTYMNHSGVAVKKTLEQERGTPKRLVVVYDDIDLPLGTLKVSFGRGAGGHNGVQSIIDTLGTKDFTRVRIGIGPQGILGFMRRPRGEALSRYVLGDFTHAEDLVLVPTIEKACDTLRTIIVEGRETAMNTHNTA